MSEAHCGCSYFFSQICYHDKFELDKDIDKAHADIFQDAQELDEQSSDNLDVTESVN